MIQLYRFVAFMVYMLAFKWGWMRASRDELWAGRLVTKLPDKTDIWLHAASVGEVRIISHLLDYLRHHKPTLRCHITVMTRTGYQTARSTCGDFAQVSYFPLDVPILWKKFLDKLQPTLVVIAETEIWPNLIESLADRKIPVVLINGRLSEKAFGRYKFVRSSIGKLLSSYHHLFLKAGEDHERFRQLGVPDNKMTLAGDMKFDAPLVIRTAQQNEAMRQFLSVAPDQFLFIAGSTRPGEEAQLVALYRNLINRFPQLRMVLVPRHIERTNEIFTLIRESDVEGKLAGSPINPDDPAIRVVDKMGILIDLFASADIAFVGGTLVELGGHNLLEPVWAGTPVLFGPSVHNVSDAAQYITSHQFGRQVKDVDEMQSVIVDLLEGKQSFARKTQADLSHSSTATAGNHILGLLSHA